NSDGVSFGKLFSVETINDEAYHSQLITWMTFNILVRNYDAHGKNISFFVGKQGLEISPFYDLVNIEAIMRVNHNKMNDGSGRISQTYAMSIGDTESGSSGNFENPYTAYMFADFANEFNISLPRMTLLMGNTIKQVLSSINEAKQSAIQQGLSSDEIKHVDLCIAIIQEAATDLQIEVSNITSMKDLI
nr:HipA domain-containing protein [Colwellia sp.]